MTPLTNSPLLDLPAELRNEIYELAFSSTSSTELVDLLAATPPSKALLLTCKKLHTEAKDLYKSAYRHYWKSTTFEVRRISKTEYATSSQEALAALKEDDIQHIEKLSIVWVLKSSRLNHWRLVDKRGVWFREWGKPAPFLVVTLTELIAVPGFEDPQL